MIKYLVFANFDQPLYSDIHTHTRRAKTTASHCDLACILSVAIVVDCRRAHIGRGPYGTLLCVKGADVEAFLVDNLSDGQVVFTTELVHYFLNNLVHIIIRFKWSTLHLRDTTKDLRDVSLVPKSSAIKDGRFFLQLGAQVACFHISRPTSRCKQPREAFGNQATCAM
jgi:hypothetical protein